MAEKRAEKVSAAEFNVRAQEICEAIHERTKQPVKVPDTKAEYAKKYGTIGNANRFTPFVTAFNDKLAADRAVAPIEYSEDIKKALSILEEALKKARIDASEAVKQDLASIRGSYNETQKSLDETTKELEKAEEEHAKALAEITRQKDRVADREAALLKAEAHAASLQAKVVEVEKTLAATEATLKATVGRAEDLAKRLEETEKKLDAERASRLEEASKTPKPELAPKK